MLISKISQVKRERRMRIVFSGALVTVISTSGGNSAIDSEAGYRYTDGAVVAIMPSGGMANEAVHCQSFSSVGIRKSIALQSGSYLTAVIGDNAAEIKLPASLSGYVICLGSSSAEVTTSKTTESEFGEGNVIWK